jgi:hypothetical protein
VAIYTYEFPNPDWYWEDISGLISISSGVAIYLIRIISSRSKGRNCPILLGLCPVEDLLILLGIGEVTCGRHDGSI